MNEKDDMITHLGILSNLENGRNLARFSNSPGTGTNKRYLLKRLSRRALIFFVMPLGFFEPSMVMISALGK